MLSPLAAITPGISATVAAVVRGITSPFAPLLADNVAAKSSGTGELPLSRADHDRMVDRSLQQFSSQLLGRLRDAGIDRSRPIIIRADGFGGLESNVEHPEFHSIDQILSQEPGLAALFQELVTVLRQHPATAAQGPLKATSVEVSLQGDKWELISPISRSAAPAPL